MWLTELKTRYMQGHQATPGGAAASLVILFILLIAVLHGDALEPPALADRRRGLLHRQPVPDGLVGFAVQGGVQHALQSEISVGFLKQRWAKGQGQHQLPCFAAGTNLCPCAGRGWDTRGIPALGTFCITWDVESPKEHLCCPPHSGVAEVPLGCLGQQIKAL